MRSEAEIIGELRQVCTSPGYIHVAAYLSWRYNFIFYADELHPEDCSKGNPYDVLIRTEISLLIGLMAQGIIDLQVPDPEIFQSLADRSHELLSELHNSILADSISPPNPDEGEDGIQKFLEGMSDSMESGQFLKETIFYSAESAYQFQYRELGYEKYSSDDQWLLANKGFSVNTARLVLARMALLQNKKMNDLELSPENIHEWTVLPAFGFSIEEICADISCPQDEVKNFIQAFSTSTFPCNETFRAIGDFNLLAAQPILQVEGDKFYLLQHYNLLESFYESPFYWMNADKRYKDTAAENRGEFTEQFSLKRLRDVFGPEHVHANVQIVDSSGKDAGEVDVLVLYADRAIILQAKSKKLTAKSRGGDGDAIREDFHEAVQAAYD